MKRRRIFFFVLIAAGLGGFAWLVLREPPEPTYQGKSVSAWLQPSKDNDMVRSLEARGFKIIFLPTKEMTNAILHIGTNAIPTLLRMVRSKDSNLKLKLLELVRKQNIVTINLRPPAGDRHSQAAGGFEALGGLASNAVPALIAIYAQNISVESQVASIDCLGGIGPAVAPAVPSLLGWMASTNFIIRREVNVALGRIHAQAKLVVPVLIKSLHDPDAEVRRAAALALEQFEADAKPAVPALIQSLADQDAHVRENAANTLKAIDPAAAAKAQTNLPPVSK